MDKVKEKMIGNTMRIEIVCFHDTIAPIMYVIENIKKNESMLNERV